MPQQDRENQVVKDLLGKICNFRGGIHFFTGKVLGRAREKMGAEKIALPLFQEDLRMNDFFSKNLKTPSITSGAHLQSADF